MASQSRAFRVYAAVGGCGAVALTVVLAWLQPGPSPWTVLLFSGLVIFSTNRSVEIADGLFVNADFMIMLAAVVAFRDHGAYVGAAIVGLARALDVDQVRRRAWTIIGGNALNGVAGMMAAAATLHRLAPSPSAHVVNLIFVAVLTAAACIVALCCALVPAVVLRGQPLRVVLANLGPMMVESIPFSMLGFFLGRLYLSIGAAAVLMLIVPMFIAREVFASYMHVKRSHEETVNMLIRALEAKDRYTAGHAERVAQYARYIGEELNFMPARLERLRFAALMHDIGKLVVPNHLLNKAGRLTADEFAQVRIHEKVSVQMLSHIDFLRPIAASSHSDHTRFDADDPNHPIEPYIVMIADAYDAMTSTRSYRKALTQEVAFAELREKAGAQFHPQCVEALIHAI